MKKTYLIITLIMSAFVSADIPHEIYLENLIFNEADWDSSERLILEKNYITDYSEIDKTLALLFFYTEVC